MLRRKLKEGNMSELDEMYAVNTTVDEPAKRQRQMVSAEQRLRKEAERLLALTAEIEKRLEPILRPSVPPPAPSGNNLDTVDRDGGAAPLAARLEESANRFNHAGNRLDGIMTRLEV
jgi:hypothetical protein